jgi:hypothetical protein
LLGDLQDPPVGAANPYCSSLPFAV